MSIIIANEITEKELIQAIVDSNKANSSERYTFFLGAELLHNQVLKPPKN
jgi:hypothetical protein